MVESGRSFGGYLRQQRQRRGMSLGEVARRTHVRSQVLRIIEADDHLRLPDPLFVRSFIRAYARMIGADADHALGLFETSRQGHLAAQQVDADIDRYETGFGRRLMACMLVVAVTAVLEIAVLEYFDDAAPQPGSVCMGQASVDSASMGPGATDASGGQGQTAAHRLVVVAQETTWMRISLDGQPPGEYRLLAGDRLEVDALRTMDLLIGNAPGVDLIFNRSPVTVDGQAGQVVRLRLP